MASKRRGGNGFRPPELRGTLGTLLRTTTGVVRDALERGAREGRARLDGARASLDSARASLDGRRAADRRHDALADLGELLLDLIRRGEVDLAELPEARDLVRELDQLDDDATAADLDAEPDLPRAASRRRFDDRGAAATAGRRDASDDDGTVSSAAWRAERPTRVERPDRPTRAERPDRPTRAERPDRPTIAERADRPTVSDRPRDADTSTSRAPTSSPKPTWRARIDDAPPAADNRSRIDNWNAAQTHPISRASLGAPPSPDPRRAPSATDPSERIPRSWTDRPDRDTDRDPTEHPDRDSERIRTEPSDRADRRAILPRDPTRKGGISFDDEDLGDYMHPDDVPPKPHPKDPGDHEA